MQLDAGRSLTEAMREFYSDLNSFLNSAAKPAPAKPAAQEVDEADD